MNINEPIRWRCILGNTDAQAMTEFVLVIPIVLFVFFASLQTSVIAQTSQLVNYAAFTAARSYATSFSLFAKDDPSTAHEKAKDRAKSAATVVLAPVSHAQLGEALFLWNPLRSVAEQLGYEAEVLYSLVEGYAVAWLYRIKNFDITATRGTADVALSHSQPPTVSDSRKTLHVSFDYLCPLMIPGLRAIWNYLYFQGEGAGPLGRFDEFGTFDQHWQKGYLLTYDTGVFDFTNEFQNFLTSMATSLNSQGGGIFGDIFGTLGINGTFLHNLNVQVDNLVNGIYGAVPLMGAVANIPIRGKCEMGFEPWSGTARTKGGTDAASISPELENCLDTMTNNQAAINATGTWMEAECQYFPPASNAWAVAQADYSDCLSNTNHPGYSTGCALQRQEELNRRIERNAAQARCERAGDVLRDMNEQNSRETKAACENISGGPGVFDPGGDRHDI